MPLRKNPTPAQVKPSSLAVQKFRLTQEPRLLRGFDLTQRQTPTTGHKFRLTQEPRLRRGSNLTTETEHLLRGNKKGHTLIRVKKQQLTNCEEEKTNL